MSWAEDTGGGTLMYCNASEKKPAAFPLAIMPSIEKTKSEKKS
jgi:hypothetical protein